jgi:hypothetical protein
VPMQREAPARARGASECPRWQRGDQPRRRLLLAQGKCAPRPLLAICETGDALSVESRFIVPRASSAVTFTARRASWE